MSSTTLVSVVARQLARESEGDSMDANDFSEEEFKPRGTVAIVALFTVTLVLLWLSIYLILIARGVTVI
jgi:hypothetical protein